MEEQQKRRFSLDDDFMKSRTNAQLYGFMRCLSTTLPEDEKWKEYLLLSTFNKSKKVIMDICGIGSAKTLKRHMDALIEAELVEEGEIEIKSKKYPCYFFPYDFDGIYRLVEKEMVRYLVYTRNRLAIKVYLYLLNCQSTKKDWEFTINEISVALGYAKSTQTAEEIIRDCLESFKREGVINYIDTYKTIENEAGINKPSPIKILKFVATSTSQLK